MSAVGDDVYRIATLGKAECAGVQLSSLAAVGANTVTGCLILEAPVAELSGNIAISEVDSSLWVWVGDIVKKSSDGGAAWE
jgi:hypothetical protein